MINLLSYVGMPLQSELCLWNIVGLIITIFDATLFKVNSNLKQVWTMDMPSELSMPVQRGLRTMISGIMLVQCFTVYVYLASYIVMVYPLYLEERPSLLLPWLLIAAVKKLLCELISLALGLGTCVLVGPTRTTCIKFVVSKIASLLPSFYMWMLVYSYYSALKIPNTFITLPAVRQTGSEQDFCLELAVRRRRTKSLQDEDQLRNSLLRSFRSQSFKGDAKSDYNQSTNLFTTSIPTLSDESAIKIKNEIDMARSSFITSNTEWMEDWFGSEIAMPRDSDRVVNQFSLMLLRIAAFINSGETDTRKFLISQCKSVDEDNNTMEPIEQLAKSHKKLYRNSTAPTVKSMEAIVSICLPNTTDDTQQQSKQHSMNYSHDLKICSKDSLLHWDRTRKAKQIKLNKMLKVKRSQQTTKIKVSQSILDLIDECKRKVQSQLNVKNNIEYKTYLDIHKPDFVDNACSSSRSKNQTNNTEKINKGNIGTKHDKGVSTHDKYMESNLFKPDDNILEYKQKRSEGIKLDKNQNVKIEEVEKTSDTESFISLNSNSVISSNSFLEDLTVLELKNTLSFNDSSMNFTIASISQLGPTKKSSESNTTTTALEILSQESAQKREDATENVSEIEIRKEMEETTYQHNIQSNPLCETEEKIIEQSPIIRLESNTVSDASIVSEEVNFRENNVTTSAEEIMKQRKENKRLPDNRSL